MKFSRSALQFDHSFAVVGFVVSGLAHGVTFFGRNPHERFPNIWGLHVGMFVACIPALIAGKNLVGSYRYHDYWNLALRYISPAFRYNVYAFMVYAVINFFACLAQLKFGVPGIFHGQPALTSHGQLDSISLQCTIPAGAGHQGADVFRALDGVLSGRGGDPEIGAERDGEEAVPAKRAVATQH